MSSWRGHGGRRAKGRRGDQDPEPDNTAWLAELEREAAQADDDEEDWASTLRSRRSTAPPAAAPPPPGSAPPPPGSAQGPPGSAPGPPFPPAEPSWSPADPGRSPADPGRSSPSDDRLGGMEPEQAGPSAWDPGPPPAGPPPAAPPPDETDWSSWRRDPGEPRQGGRPEADWGGRQSDPGQEGWYPAEADTPTGAWSPVEPPSREPDYPALFGELYRRSAAQQDPIWEAPPAAEPLPDPGQPDPPSTAWPFEETTQTWEPSDRSFIWPSDELPSTQTEWDQPAPSPWPGEPTPPPPPAPPAPAPRPSPWADSGPDPRTSAGADEGLDPRTSAWGDPDPQTSAWADPDPQTSAWADPGLDPRDPARADPDPRTSAWADPATPSGPLADPGRRASAWSGGTAAGNGAPPGPVGPVGPPPADWAAAIPTDVPAASRVADPGAATRAWRPDETVEAEPAVPLGSGALPPAGRAARAPVEPEQDLHDAAAEDWDATPADGRRPRPAGERPRRSWPRVVAVISWIVLVMVFCWYYVFPWLERVLPENF